MTGELIPRGGAILRPWPLPERGDPDGKARRQGRPGLNRGKQGTETAPAVPRHGRADRLLMRTVRMIPLLCGGT